MGVGVGKAIMSHTYNDNVVAVNIKIGECLNNIEGACFWHHRGFWGSYNFLGRDGVHIQFYLLQTVQQQHIYVFIRGTHGR